MIHLFTDIGNVCIWATSIGIAVWVIQYSLLAKWWRNTIGITMVGNALCILAIYIPSLMALADPADYVHFAAARWYLWLAVVIVVATAVFIITRIVTWEVIRRQRNGGRNALLPAEMAARITELQAERDELRRQLDEIITGELAA